MPRHTLKIIAGYALICFIWGTTWFAIKTGLEGFPPFISAVVRFLIAISILSVIIAIKKIRIPRTAKAKRVYILLGLLGFSFPFCMIYWGQQFITTGMSAVLFGVYPFLVALFSWIFLKDEPMSVSKFLGIVVGFAGLIVLFVRDIRLDSETSFYGALAIIVSASMQALNIVLIKKDAADIPIEALNLVSMSIGAAIIFIVALFVEDFSAIHLSLSSVGAIAYLGSFGSVVTFGVYFWLLKRINTVLLSLSALITPVIAVITGVVLLHEQITGGMLFGSALVLSGILIANMHGLKELMHQRSRAV